MIPKIIHLCWLSGDAFPRDIAACLESWKQHLKDYELWLWGKKPKDCLGLNIVEKNFDIDSVLWCKQAFETRKYAFAADFIRLYALYNYGGIYLDSDVIVYKSFDDLLQLPYFIGEDEVGCFEPAIIGAEPKQNWINVILARYDGLDFVNSDGSYNMQSLPVVFYDQLVPCYRFRRVRKPISIEDFEDNIINVFPSTYFNSRNHIGAIKTPDSYCSHNYVGSWIEKRNDIKRIIKRITPRKIISFYYANCHVLYKHHLDSLRIPFEKD